MIKEILEAYKCFKIWLLDMCSKCPQDVTEITCLMNLDGLLDELGWLSIYHSILNVFKIRIHREPEYLSERLSHDKNNCSQCSTFFVHEKLLLEWCSILEQTSGRLKNK